jgi:hypothetical protein
LNRGEAVHVVEGPLDNGQRTMLGVELKHHVPLSLTGSGPVCENGFLVEDFGLSTNLMIASSAHIVYGDVRACLATMAETYAVGTPPSLYRQDGES